MLSASPGGGEEAMIESPAASAVAETRGEPGVTEAAADDGRPQRARRLPRFLQENYVMEGDETERDTEEEE